MEDSSFIISYDFEASDDAIHELAVALLLSELESELVLIQGNFAYLVRGGDDGYLSYKKGVNGKRVLLANWCFYRLYIVVRYRKPIWLRPMYASLFGKMNFASVAFKDYSIELVSSDGHVLQRRRFRLSPPSAFDKVMSEKFGYYQEQSQFVRTAVGLD